MTFNVQEALRGYINRKNGLAGLNDSGKIGADQMPTLLKLLTPNADAFAIGSPTEEGGDLKIYRNASGDLQVYVDADAASNAKALDVYGGVVCQNYLTVGATALNTTYTFRVVGTSAFTQNVYLDQSLICGAAGSVRAGTGGVQSSVANQAILDVVIPITTLDASIHSIGLQVNFDSVFDVQATGDGAGGIVGKRSTQYGGQCHAKTDAGAADYNPSIETSDYIISVDTTAAARAVIISTEDRDSGTPGNPRVFIIKDIAGNAGTNHITISLETAGTIDGAANVAIGTNYGSVTVMVDGTNGFTI